MKRGRKPMCPYCGAKHTIGKGVRKTATVGLRRLRVCKSCRRKFTIGRKPVVNPAPAVPALTPPAAVVHDSPGLFSTGL